MFSSTSSSTRAKTGERAKIWWIRPKRRRKETTSSGTKLLKKCPGLGRVGCWESTQPTFSPAVVSVMFLVWQVLHETPHSTARTPEELRVIAHVEIYAKSILKLSFAGHSYISSFMRPWRRPRRKVDAATWSQWEVTGRGHGGNPDKFSWKDRGGKSLGVKWKEQCEEGVLGTAEQRGLAFVFN